MRRLTILALTCLASLSWLTGQVDPYDNLPRHRISPTSLPEPYESRSVTNPPKVILKSDGDVLKVPDGFTTQLVLADLAQPRKMVLAPNGDLFISESRGDKVSVHRDLDGDGEYDAHWTFTDDLNKPFGLAFAGGWLYIGNTNSLVRLPYTTGQTVSEVKPQKIIDLPSGGHWTRGVLYHEQENKLYVSVGSRQNIGEEASNRAAVLRCNLDGTELEVYASGLRNPVDLALNSITNVVWTVVNERDGLGDNLVPDYATHIEKGGFYGWPYSYIGPHPMPGYAKKRPDLVAKTLTPDVLFVSHSAALGIEFYEGEQFPEHFRGGAFVAHHGSWNRKIRTGYQVVYLPFDDEGHAKGYYEPFATGWKETQSEKTVWGRPVCVLVDGDGSLLISDDGGNRVWRISYAGGR